MFKLRIAALASLVLLALPLVSRADQVVYSQPATTPVTDISFDSAGFTTFQMFTMTQGATVTSISFDGAWVQSSGQPNPPMPSATDFFVILGSVPNGLVCTNPPTCTLSALSSPNSVLANVEGTPAQFNETYLGSQSNFTSSLGIGPVDMGIYSYQIDFATPFDMTPGIYALSTFAELESGDSDTYWFSTNGTNGSMQSLEFDSGRVISYDQNFTLYGTPNATTPEPSSLALIVFGLACVFFFAWKMRTSPPRRCRADGPGFGPLY
jgi:hypothetical protein